MWVSSFPRPVVPGGLTPPFSRACFKHPQFPLPELPLHSFCPALTKAWCPYPVRQHLLRALGLVLLGLGASGQGPCVQRWFFLPRELLLPACSPGRLGFSQNEASLGPCLTLLVSCPRGQGNTQANPRHPHPSALLAGQWPGGFWG